jgi:hypothetical protein
MISKELLGAVLGSGEVDTLESFNLDSSGTCIMLHYIDSDDYINIHELAYKCKEWAKEKGYYLQSGFNIDIIEDNGLDIDFNYETVNKFNTDVWQLVFNGKKASMEMVASMGDNENADFKACQWIYDKEMK